MMLDIFSSFDDHNRVFMDLNYFIWFVCFMAAVFFSRSFHTGGYGGRTLLFSAKSLVEGLVSRTQSANLGGSLSVFTSLFFCLVIFNLAGLLPYMFSMTSHLAINLGLSLPIWISIVMSSMFFDLPAFLAHLQPVGAPAMLNPFLCVIELVSLVVRPLTLAVRLTANLSTGHILMALLGSGFISCSFALAPLVMALGSFYFIFEMGVCVIQGYIFTLLPTLYLDEHPVKH